MTLATSRVKQHPPAVGRDVDVLGDVGAEEQHRVGAVLALDRVVAVARVPLEDVVAGAEKRDVVAVVAEDEVVAVAAEDVSAPWLPRMVSLPAPPSMVSFDDAGRQRRGRDAVVAAAAPLTTSASFAPSELVMFTRAGRPTTETEVPAPTTSMMSSPLVPLTMTVSACGVAGVPPIVPARLMLTCVTSVPAQVVDGDGVGAAQRVEVDASRHR